MGRDDVLSAFDVSRETAHLLDIYVALLQKWQRRINLVAESTLKDVWRRHILDCGQLIRFVSAGQQWVDLGSGAGLPGLVLAILAQDRFLGFRVILVESNRKKAAFLAEAVRETGVSAVIVSERVEAAIARGAAAGDVATARALAPLSDLLTLSAPLLLRGADAFFLKGQSAAAELTEAAKSWRFSAELLPSLSDSSGAIVHIRSFSPPEAG